MRAIARSEHFADDVVCRAGCKLSVWAGVAELASSLRIQAAIIFAALQSTVTLHTTRVIKQKPPEDGVPALKQPFVHIEEHVALKTLVITLANIVFCS